MILELIQNVLMADKFLFLCYLPDYEEKNKFYEKMQKK